MANYNPTDWGNDRAPALDADHLNKIEKGIADSIRRDGDSMNFGATLTLGSNPVQPLDAVPKQYADNKFFQTRKTLDKSKNTQDTYVDIYVNHGFVVDDNDPTYAKIPEGVTYVKVTLSSWSDMQINFSGQIMLNNSEVARFDSYASSGTHNLRHGGCTSVILEVNKNDQIGYVVHDGGHCMDAILIIEQLKV